MHLKKVAAVVGKAFYKLTAFVLLIILMLSMYVNATAFIPGDANGDGKVSADDARAILRYSVSIDKYNNEILQRADVDKDGKITAEDARKALRLSIGIIEVQTEYGELSGFTENGYAMYTKNGMTYIDGILIANKTYSLPSSYAPNGLLTECSSAFNQMKKDAAAKGLNLYISSGYRSYSSQSSIYNRYVSRDGRKLADTYSARPGHSEHQTGLAIDLNTITQSFANTAECKWVAENCHKYGFIIRYPKGKTHITGYYYEPWHLRYVGVEKATKIYNSGLCLEEYYGITSEYK